MDNVEHGRGVVVGAFITAILGRRVRANVDVLATDGDLSAVGLVGDAVDFLEVVGVGDQLIAGDDVLCMFGQRRSLGVEWWGSEL